MNLLFFHEISKTLVAGHEAKLRIFIADSNGKMATGIDANVEKGKWSHLVIFINE